MEGSFVSAPDLVKRFEPFVLDEFGADEIDSEFAEWAAEQEEEQEYLERVMQEEMERAKERLPLEMEAEKRILDYDPKQGGVYYSRLYYVHDLATFDHDEESPLGPMRYTDAVYSKDDDYELCEAINVFSVKIASSDVGFPIDVYGTVIARDSLDKKCVYLFRRDRDQSQLISSKDDSLILTGPKRGLALIISSTYVETNLKIKGHQGQEEDRELSKGVLKIPGIERRVLKKCELESCSLATRLSTVEVMYGVVKDAVEATIAIEVVSGDFCGEVKAQASSIDNSLVLYNSRLGGVVTTSGEKVIPLLRSVVAVYVKEKLLLNIAAHTDYGEEIQLIDYTPKVNGSSHLTEVTAGSAILRVKVAWSIIDL